MGEKKNGCLGFFGTVRREVYEKNAICSFFSAMMAMVLLLGGCGSSETKEASTSAKTTTEERVFRSIEHFPYGGSDPHKEYYAWHTQKYGLSETLFRINADLEIEPWLAESITTDGTVSTIRLKDGVCFSNGNPLTADMVKRNLERVPEVNNRFFYMSDWVMEAPDEKTVVIDTVNPYPTLKNDLISPEISMIDLDATTDFMNNPICTGPFKLESFVPDGDSVLVKNENYWGGEVQLDRVVFYGMGDDQSKVMAMQNGEVDGYDNINTNDMELFASQPEKYTVTSTPMKTRGYMFLNAKVLPDSVREAIALMIDREAIAAYIPGMVTSASTAFGETLPYGKAKPAERDVEKARAVLEADGYVLENGYYTKDGQVLS